METHTRRLIRTSLWRFIGSLMTTLIVFAATRRLDFSLGAGAIDVCVKLVVHNLYEYFWGRVKWGRK